MYCSNLIAKNIITYPIILCIKKSENNNNQINDAEAT